jgi:hypothetical protein
MDARQAAAQQVGGDDAITTKIGAVALPLGVIVLVVAELFHPGKTPSTTRPSSGSMPRAMSGPPFTSASTSAFSSCSAAWSPSITPLVPSPGLARHLRPSASPRR